jgi:hypothetical protein
MAGTLRPVSDNWWTWGRCSAKFEFTAFAKFKLSAFPVGWLESLGEEDSMDTIREALKKGP